MVRRENSLPVPEGAWGALCLLTTYFKRGEEPGKIRPYPVPSRAVGETKRSVITHDRPGQRS